MPPNLTLNSAGKIARDLYGLEATASSLPSERDQNFLLETASGEKFVLKLANATEERSMLEAQNAAMAHLAKHIDLCPRVIPTKNGDDIASVNLARRKPALRPPGDLPARHAAGECQAPFPCPAA